MNRRQPICSLIVALLRMMRRKRRNVRSPREWWVCPIFMERQEKGAWVNLIPVLRETDPNMFFNFLRMYPVQFDTLVSLTQDQVQKFSWREPISPGERLCISLRYMASGDSMISLAYLFRVAKSTISLIIFETCAVLWDVLSPFVFGKLTEEFWKKTASEFETRWNFPHCVGALDGKHCVVHAFAQSGSEYFNHKGTHSLVLLALVSANYKFISVDIGAAGRQIDAGVFRSSAFGQALDSGTLNLPPPAALEGTNETFPYVIVGDAAFQLKTNFMRPYPGEFLSVDKTIFNYRLSRARNVLENAFGILASRWRVFKKPICVRKNLGKVIMKATVCLYIYLITEELHERPSQRRYVTPTTADVYDCNGDVVRRQWRTVVTERDAIRDVGPTLRMGARNFSAEASDVGEKFTDYFLGPVSIKWQWQEIPCPATDEVES